MLLSFVCLFVCLVEHLAGEGEGGGVVLVLSGLLCCCCLFVRFVGLFVYVMHFVNSELLPRVVLGIDFFALWMVR